MSAFSSPAFTMYQPDTAYPYRPENSYRSAPPSQPSFAISHWDNTSYCPSAMSAHYSSSHSTVSSTSGSSRSSPVNHSARNTPSPFHCHTTFTHPNHIQVAPPQSSRPRYVSSMSARKEVETRHVPNPFLAYAPIVEKALREGRTVRETLAQSKPLTTPPSALPALIPNPFFALAQQIASERNSDVRK